MSLEENHSELEGLVERLRRLIYQVFQHNPAFEGNDKTSLVTLGMEARSIGVRFEIIGVSLINIHKESQRNESTDKTI